MKTTLKTLEWKTVGSFDDVLAVKITTKDDRKYVYNIMKYKGEYSYTLYNDWSEVVDQYAAETILQLIDTMSCLLCCEMAELLEVAIQAEKVCKE